MKSSFIFEIDDYILDVFYTYKKGMDGDGWNQPDDPDELEYDEIYLIGGFNEDGVGTVFENVHDIKNLLSNEIIDNINYAMQEDLEENDYFR